MTKKSVTSDLPTDQKESYRLLIKYPHIWIPIVIFVIGTSFWFGQFYAKIEIVSNKNESTLDIQKEMQNIRLDERGRCDTIVAGYERMINKLTPHLTKNENK